MSDSTSSNIADKLKQTIDELEIDRHVNDLVIQVETAFTTARDKVATLAAERGDEVERFLDKVSTSIDERTEGRFAPQVGKVRETVSTGVTRLAEYRPADVAPTDTPAVDPNAWAAESDEIEPPHAH